MKKSAYILLAMFTANSLQGQSVVWSAKSNSTSGLATYTVTFSADGAKVLSGSECHPANIRMFDAETGALEWSYDVGTSFFCIQGVKFSSNGSLIASVEELGNILIFDAQNGDPVILDTIKTGTSYAFSADFAPTSDRLAVGASNGKMNIYDLPGGGLFKSVSAHLGYVYSVDYAPDGTMIASGSADKKVKIWTAEGIVKFTLNGHSKAVSSVKFSPDNNFLVTGSLDGQVKIWSTTDGSLVRTINAHNAEVKQVDISPDGTMIVSASSDQTCKIWSAQTGALLSTFGVPDGGIVWSAAWSPLGGRIATGTSKGDVVMWDVSGVVKTEDLPPTFAGVDIYPNPVADIAHLRLPPELSLSALEICDVMGRSLWHLDPSDRQFSVTEMPQGLFFLKMTALNGEIATLRVWVVRR